MFKVYTKYFEYGEKEISYLSQKDRILGEAIARLGKVERTVIPDLFQALVFAVIGQQISAKAAETIWNRLRNEGEITPSGILEISPEVIQRCGLTYRKVSNLKEIADAVYSGSFNLTELKSFTDSQVIKSLSTLKGIGTWTAEMLLLNSMERPDVVSFGDIAIKRGMMKLYGLSEITRDQFQDYRRRYSPYGSVASIYLWRISFE